MTSGAAFCRRTACRGCFAALGRVLALVAEIGERREVIVDAGTRCHRRGRRRRRPARPRPRIFAVERDGPIAAVARLYL